MVSVWLERRKNKVKATFFATCFFFSSKHFVFQTKSQSWSLLCKISKNQFPSIGKAFSIFSQKFPCGTYKKCKNSVGCLHDPLWLYYLPKVYKIWTLMFVLFYSIKHFFSVTSSEDSAQMNNFLDRDWLLSSMYYTYKLFKN